jgi:hypothetical protein
MMRIATIGTRGLPASHVEEKRLLKAMLGSFKPAREKGWELCQS